MFNSHSLVIDDEQWRAFFTVDGVSYQRCVGPSTLTETQALAALEPFIKAAQTPRIDDVTFRELAQEWEHIRLCNCSPERQRWIHSLLKRSVYPTIGHRMAKGLTTTELTKVTRAIADDGRVTTAHALMQIIGQVLRYGAETKRAVDMTKGLHAYLPRRNVQHHPTFLDNKGIRRVMTFISSLPDVVLRSRLMLQAYTFTRSTECRLAAWRDFDFRACLWSIPMADTKMKRQHLVPLAPPVVQMLSKLRKATGHGVYLFPSPRYPDQPLSKYVASYTLRREFHKDEFSLHGFRSMATSILTDKGWSKDVINRQLAHKDKDVIWTSYCMTEYLAERRKMMRAWADFLDNRLL